MNISWNDTEVAMLKRLAADGLSASAIAERIGSVSRNAVLGKAMRLNIKLLGKPSAPARISTTKAKLKPEPMVRIKKFVPLVETAPPPIVDSIIAPVSLAVTLVELERGQCKWPSGERTSTTFCGHPVHDDAAYCPYHCKVSYRPREKHKRAA